MFTQKFIRHGSLYWPMEYRTVSTKLPSDESTMFRAYCEKKGVTPASLIRELILREMGVTIPNMVAGKNKIHYSKNNDSFGWSVELDSGKTIDVLDNISPAFIENLAKMLNVGLQERATSIQKKKRNSVSIPSKILRG